MEDALLILPRLLIAAGCVLFAGASFVLCRAVGRLCDLDAELRQTRRAFLRAVERAAEER